VAWRLYRDIHHSHDEKAGAKALSNENSGDSSCAPTPPHDLRKAIIQIAIADVSMSLDNVLAVAGIARDHFQLLAFGLVLSVALMGIASTYIARLLDRHFWISWVGLGIVTFVALRMIWEGSTEVIKQTAALTLPGV